MNILKWFQFAFRLAPALASIAHAEGPSVPPAIVVQYCSGCHGIDGISQLPYIPRLAGLSAEYMARKLANFRGAASPPVDEAFKPIVHSGSARKDRSLTLEGTAHMVGTARAISDKDLQAAALWYAAQPPAPGKHSKPKMIEEARNVYINGLPSRHVPACQSCHGPEAQGTNTAPRLAGQNAAYMLGQLALFRTSDRDNSPMTEAARSLENDQAAALAAYLHSR